MGGVFVLSSCSTSWFGLLHCDVILFNLVMHTILFILSVHVSVLGVMSLVRCTCASWHKKTGGRVSAALVCFLSRDTPKCRAACPPPPCSRRAPVKRIVVPGGPYQYYAVHQYSVVRRVWGASGVYMFLIFAPPTPPQNLIARILSTPVRCIQYN